MKVSLGLVGYQDLLGQLYFVIFNLNQAGRTMKKVRGNPLLGRRIDLITLMDVQNTPPVSL